MTKEEYISYKKTLFQAECNTRIRLMEKAVNQPHKDLVFVYCDTDAVCIYTCPTLSIRREHLFRNELMFNKKPVKWAVSECYCGNHSFFLRALNLMFLMKMLMHSIKLKSLNLF